MASLKGRSAGASMMPRLHSLLSLRVYCCSLPAVTPPVGVREATLGYT